MDRKRHVTFHSGNRLPFICQLQFTIDHYTPTHYYLVVFSLQGAVTISIEVKVLTSIPIKWVFIELKGAGERGGGGKKKMGDVYCSDHPSVNDLILVCFPLWRELGKPCHKTAVITVCCSTHIHLVKLAFLIQEHWCNKWVFFVTREREPFSCVHGLIVFVKDVVIVLRAQSWPLPCNRLSHS